MLDANLARHSDIFGFVKFMFLAWLESVGSVIMSLSYARIWNGTEEWGPDSVACRVLMSRLQSWYIDCVLSLEISSVPY